MSIGKDKGDFMPLVIERIISIERAEADAFMKIQQKRLTELKEMERKKNAGEVIDVKPIVKGLQEAGILDEKGNLAAPYRSVD